MAFVKVDKDIVEWKYFNKDHMLRFWLYLICKAAYKDCYYDGIDLKKGQVIVGRKKLSEKLNLSEQTVKTYLSRLKSTGEITTKATNKFTIVTIVNWEKYQYIPQFVNQQNNQGNSQQVTNNQPTINQQVTTIKEIKEQLELKESLIKESIHPISPFPDVEKELEDKQQEFDSFYKTNLFDVFESEFARPLSPTEMQRLSEWKTTYDDKLIRYALRESLVYDKRNFDYIDKILTNWTSNGFTANDYENGKR